MRTFLQFIFFIACVNFSRAQNLVPDSSFEYNKSIPINYSALDVSTSWNSPSRATTDLFCKCGKKQEKLSHVNVPQNAMGYQEAHSGNCYAGLFACSHGLYREYLQTSLSSALERGKEYEVILHVSLADYSPLAVDKLGVCFLTNKVKYEHSEVLTGLPAIQVPIEQEIGTEITKWHELTVRYKAKGGENTLLIGCFEIKKLRRTGNMPPTELSTMINKKMERDAYYYFDDISLHEYKPEIIDTTEAPENPYFANLPQDSVETILIAPDTLNQISVEEVLVFKNVTFNTGETILSPSSYPELHLLAEHLNADTKLRVELYGHTDNAGDEKKNKELSFNRAKAVAEYLMNKGVVSGNITYEGFGSLKPLDTNETEEGRKNNRRVEFILKRKDR